MLLFTQQHVATSACAFLDVLIGNAPRKTALSQSWKKLVRD